MTVELARSFAKLLNAGCPPLRASLYAVPNLDTETAQLWTHAWMHSSEVVAAVIELEGGEWVDLPAEKRYEIALNKHISEMAFYLRTTNFNEIEHKEGLEKMKQAREVLKAEVRGTADETDPSMAFARFAMELLKVRAEREAESKAEPLLGPQSKSGAIITQGSH